MTSTWRQILRRVAFFATVIVGAVLFIAAAAQGANRLQVAPVDEAAQNAEFAAYRDALLQAVVARDIDAILDAAAPDIHLSFGGGSGRVIIEYGLPLGRSLRPQRSRSG